MLRVKIPQGVLTARQVESLADVAEQLRARLCARHHSAEHPVSFPEAGRRRDGDAADGRRGHHDARSVRQFGAKHHGVPICRRCRRRSVRRHAVRRGADAISAAPSAGVGAAAQVQDRIRRLSRGSRVRVDQRPGLDRAHRAERDGTRRRAASGSRSAAARRFCRSSGASLFDFLPASEMFNVAEAILRVYHRLGDHEHKQRNRMKFLIKTLGWDRWRDEVLADAGAGPRRGRRASAVRSRLAAARKRRRPGSSTPTPSLDAIRALVTRDDGERSRAAADRSTTSPSDRRRVRARGGATNVRAQRQDGYRRSHWCGCRSAT